MHKFKMFFLIVCLPLLACAQNLKGTVYDANKKLPGIEVSNITQNRVTLTDESGRFSIMAEVNDSIKFSSLFYEEKTIRLTENHFKQTNVIELKESLNQLDEVMVNGIKEKKFDPIVYKTEFNSQMQNDIKNNPFYYNKATNANFDVIKVIGLISKLFKKNKRPDNTFIPIDYLVLKELFSKDKNINERFLLEDLKIEKEDHPLFLDFCTAKQIDSELLTPQNKFLLIETFVTLGSEFKELVASAEKQD